MKFYFTARGDNLCANEDYNFVEGNKGTYEAVFTFDDAWLDMTKECVCEVNGKRYVTPILGDSCLLPEMVKGSSYIGVIGLLTDYGLVSRISTKMIPFGVSRGAYNGEIGEEFKNAAEVWELYFADMEKSRKAAEAAAKTATESASAASERASIAGTSAAAATESAAAATESAGAASESAGAASESATAAGTSASSASESKRKAEIAAKTATEKAEAAATSENNASSYALEATSAASDAGRYAQSILNLKVEASEGENVFVEKTITDGVTKLSFTLPKGDKGDQGDRGPAGEKGANGYTPIKGVDYFTPEDIKSLNIPYDEVKSLQYYGDANIVPSDSDLFEFTLSPLGDGVAIKQIANTLPNELVIPYEATIDGVTYPVTFLWDMLATFRRDITKLVIPSTVKEIGISAFEGCTEMASIVLPGSVTRINTDAFYGCSALNDVYYRGTKAQWNAITISDGNSELSKERANIHYEWSEVTREHVDAEFKKATDYTDEQIAEIRPKIFEADVDYVDNFVIADNEIRSFGMPISSIAVVGNTELKVGFTSVLIFSTPSEIPTDYSTFPEMIIFKGDSVEDENFVPEANMRYTIVFDFDGRRFIGYVSGVSL